MNDHAVRPHPGIDGDNYCGAIGNQYDASLKFSIGDESFLLNLNPRAYPSVGPGLYAAGSGPFSANAFLWLGQADPGQGGLFLPDPHMPGEPGSRVIVEIAVPETSDGPLLHGRVRERVHDGVWLDVPSARPAARWEPDPRGPRRQHRRLACELFVEVQPQGGAPWLCRALDMSERGLRIATGFEIGIRGDELSATLLSPEGHQGRRAPPFG